ncbi:MAG: beta-propeller fold lactonase family protein [Steroidobacteraceae bacterium]
MSGGTATVAANATTFTLSPAINSGASYNISVTTQPSNPTENCSVTSGATGTANANVNNVVVTCAISTFTVGGTISGTLTGTGLVVKDTVSGSTKTVLPGATTFTITPAVNSGASYNITVTGQPASPTESCSVTSGASGTVGAANVTNAVVTCAISTFTVGGTIGAGYTGSGLVLKDTVSGNTTPAVTTGASTFTITPAVNSGANYDVIVQTQPTSPGQYCTVTNPTGTVGSVSVTSVTVTCRNEGRYAFVADTAAGTVTSFAIDDSNSTTAGVLTQVPVNAVATAAAGSKPVAIAVNPAGTYVYTADNGTADVTQFSVGANGAITLGVAKPTLLTGSTPTGIAVDPSGSFLLVTDSDSGLGGTGNGYIVVFAISSVDGTLTQVTNSPFLTTASALVTGVNPTSVAVDPSDQFVYATNTFNPGYGLAGFTIDSVTTDLTAGNLTQFATNPQVATGNAPVSVTIDPLGRFVYVADSADGMVSGWKIGSGGALTAMSGSPFTGGTGGFVPSATPASLAIDPSGHFLYAIDSTNGDVVAFTIDQTTGVPTALTTGATIAAGSGAVPVGIDPSGHFLYVGNTFGNTISMYSADLTTGELSVINGSPLTFSGSGPNAIAIE